LLLCALPALAEAAPVAPGETVRTGADDLRPPTGDRLAAVTRDVTISFDTAEPPLQREATITSSVWREDGSDGLTFVYEIVVDADAHPQTERLVLWDFTTRATDVAAADGDGPADVTRSDDGGSLAVDSVADVASAGAITAIVRTNATEFDDSGTALYRLTEAVSDGEGGEPLALSGSVSAPGLFQPAGGTVVPPPPAIIPLPPATVGGLATLAAAAWAMRRRHP
jgi:hypothetical protein